MKRLFSLLLGLALVIIGISQPYPASAFTFSDNFNGGDANGWIFVSRDDRVSDPASSWSVVGGRLLENSGADAQMALVENLSLSSQTLQVQADINPTPSFASIVLWYKDLNNYISIGTYGSGAAVYVGELFNGIGYGEAYPQYGPGNHPYGFKVVANSLTGEIDFYGNGVYAFTYTAKTDVRTGLSGVGGGNGGAYFDNFKVTTVGGKGGKGGKGKPSPHTLLNATSGEWEGGIGGLWPEENE